MLEETLTWLGLVVLGTAAGWLWVPAVSAGRFARAFEDGRGLTGGSAVAVLLWVVVPAAVVGVWWESDYAGAYLGAYLLAAFAPVFLLPIGRHTRVLGGWTLVSWYLVALPLTGWVVWDSGGLEGAHEFELMGHVIWLTSVGLTGALTVPGWFLAAAVEGFDGAFIFHDVVELGQSVLLGGEA